MLSRRITFAGLGIAILCALPACRGTPAEIIFLRHAEKATIGPELNARGWERAKALVPLFSQDPRLSKFGPPIAIFAMGPAKESSSIRAIQTMQAVGDKLGVKLNKDITRDQIKLLVRTIMASPAYEGKSVVVCWEHDKIPEMLKAFGWTTGPDRWDDHVYDRIWILDFEKGHPVRFTDIPQSLLPGDTGFSPQKSASAKPAASPQPLPPLPAPKSAP